MTTSLPIDSYLPEIIGKLKESSGLVLTADPGAGKTTRLPPALLEHFDGKILVLEPRRVAAAAAAMRVASERGWQAGSQVGYQVRFENRTTHQTRLIFLTEALLARKMLADSELKDVSVVILDEFHERSLHVDLALGMLRELQQLGHPLKIVVMSATLNPKPIADFLGGAPAVQVPGKLFPLTIEYSPNPLRLRLDFEYFKSLAKPVSRALQSTKGDILLFLPGSGEIRRAEDALSPLAQEKNFELHSLHGSLSWEDQQRLLQPSTRRRVILATNIAESSLTIDGVSAVIDTGLAKIMRQNPRTGFSRLTLSRIAKANANQRAGRAARQTAGLCIRLWSEAEYKNFGDQEIPEIQRTDLSEALLYLAVQGVSDFMNFSWFEIPPVAQIQKARQELFDLGAIDKNGHALPLAKQLLKWPLPPRLGKLMEIAIENKAGPLAADLCAILSERDFVPSAVLAEHHVDKWECDLSLRVDILKRWRQKERVGGVDSHALRTVQRVADRLANGLKGAEIPIGKLLLKAFPDRLARRRAQSDRAVTIDGRGIRLSESSMVKESPFLIYLDGVDLEGSADTLIQLASGLSLQAVEAAYPNEIQTTEVIHYDETSKRFVQIKERRYKNFVIEQSQPRPAKPELVRESLGSVLIEQLEWLKKRNSELAKWFQRWNFFRTHDTEVAEISSELLQEALLAAAGNIVDLEKISQLDLAGTIHSMLDYKLRVRFDREAPEKIQVPSGSWIRVEYPAQQAPFMEVRIQELFGLKSSPAVLSGKVPIVLHLLSPAYRPVQTTSDLISFWQNGYFEVRKELKARYPKHSWPDEPLTAIPQARTRRKSTT